MSRTPFIRSASFLVPDLLRATPRQNFSSEKAKQMMGAANPLTGKDNRAGASTYCPGCGRWHRPGNLCPNTKKSLESASLVKGDRAVPAGPVDAALDQLQETIDQATAPPEHPSNIGAQENLLAAKPAVSSAPKGDDKEQLMEASGHLKNQDQSYMSALRDWQAKYGG
jgi:hypothetical protein